jgi:predicted DNA-binding WGR domain protein
MRREKPKMYKLGFSEGNVDKFWQIERVGCEVRLKWGRTGTAGQSQVKNFGSEAEAEQFLEQMRKAKLKKGYLSLDSDEPEKANPPPKNTPQNYSQYTKKS